MAEVDISSEELAREQRLSQSSNNNNLGQGHKRNGSGSSNRACAAAAASAPSLAPDRLLQTLPFLAYPYPVSASHPAAAAAGSDTNGGATPRAQQHSQGASPRVPSSRDSFRDAEARPLAPLSLPPKVPLRLTCARASPEG